jgi:predicted O-methyltransferase YrrM
MNLILEGIQRDGMLMLPSGERTRVHSGVGTKSGAVLRRAVELSAPKLGCEVGLAYGISSLYILDAMKEFGGGQLIGMDPAQHDVTWQGAGLYNIERAGFADRYQFHEAPSQRVLPKLAAEGTRIQFGFIDGWHTFDHALVDFFYLDMMMDVGGAMVLDDVGYPGLQRLAHFIVTNRDYEFIEGDARPTPSGWRPKVKASVQRILHPFVRDNHTPSESARRLQQPVNACQLLALRKRGHDTRRFDHFVPF